MFIAVVNESTVVPNLDVQVMVSAVATQVKRDVCPHWGKPNIPVAFTTKALIPPGAYVISILDNADQAGALGYHYEDTDGTVYARVFAKTILDSGGTILKGSYSVSGCLSHEVIEAIVDPTCVQWAQMDDTKFVAYEACDPVEDTCYSITARVRGGTSTNVAVSDFVLPNWFDPATKTHSDFCNAISGPFVLQRNGYIIIAEAGKISQVFGDHYPAWRKDTKSSVLARTAQRA